MDLYSRQLYALGKDSLITMSNAKILIIGTETPFVEIMKNLILMGIGEITIAEVEELVPAGTLDPDHIHVPGIYVHRIFQGNNYEKRIEQRTVRK